MSSLKVTSNSDYKQTLDWLKKVSNLDMTEHLNAGGQLGVEALSAATPVDTGETAASWYYEVAHEDGTWSITWFNSNENEGVNIAVILQYGHATGTGGYVAGIDYVNPAIEPIFDIVVDDIWKEVTS